MNKKPTKFRETRGNRHPSQNDLPPIDKFHSDSWYYREEMDEPDDIDINYENESRHMNKKLVRLTESDLHRIIKESVNKILKEAYKDWTYDEEDDIIRRGDKLHRKGSHIDDFWGNKKQYDKNEQLINKATKNMLDKTYDSRYRIQTLKKAIQSEEGKKLVDKYESALINHDEITADKILKDIENYNHKLPKYKSNPN